MIKPLTEGKTLGSMCPKIPIGKPKRPIRPPPAPKRKKETHEEEIFTKVTTINSRYHCRVIRTKDDEVLWEMACAEKQDISFCIRWMLRMYDKCGGTSLMADNSRHRPARKPRGTVSYIPKGKIWYPNQLHLIKE